MVEVIPPIASSSKIAEISKVIDFKSELIIMKSKSDSSFNLSIINKLIKFESNNLLRLIVKKNART